MDSREAEGGQAAAAEPKSRRQPVEYFVIVKTFAIQSHVERCAELAAIGIISARERYAAKSDDVRP
jgi:hypothetical protein